MQRRVKLRGDREVTADGSADHRLISCIIPTCDRPAMLQQALDSVLHQTTKPLEIIVVNNGRLAVEDICAGHEAVRLVNAVPYLGVAQARNLGASLAKGDVLAFLDDDDMWPPDYLGKSISAISAGAECVVSRIDRLKGSAVSAWKNPGSAVTVGSLLLRNPGVGGSNVAVCRDVFYAVGGYDTKLETGEDKAMVLELLLTGCTVTTLADNSVVARQHDGLRLTDPAHMWKGKLAFYIKYRKYMSIVQKLQVRTQVAGYARRARKHGKLWSLLVYALHRAAWRTAARVARLFGQQGGK